MAWYIAQLNPQCEKRAAAEIRRAGYRVYVPKFTRLQINRRTKEKSVKYRPLMAGYLFVRFPEHHYDDLRTCQGVKKIVKQAGGQPFRLPEHVIPAMLRAQRQMKHEAEDVRVYRMGVRRGLPKSFDKAIAEALFSIGDSVLVVAGLVSDKVGEVVRIADNGMVEVETVHMLGKPIRKLFKPLAEVIPIQLEPTAQAA